MNWNEIEMEEELERKKESFKIVTVSFKWVAAEFRFHINSKRVVKTFIAFHFLFFKARGLILTI